MSLVGLFQAAAIVTVVFSLVTSFPSAHRNIELFSHFRLQYLAASLLLWLVFTALRSPAYSVVLITAVALNASYVLPWYFGAKASEAAGVIKLMQVNVLSRNEQRERLLQLIEIEQPDVVFLQEVSLQWIDATQMLQQDYPYHYAEPRIGNFGIAVFSRLPFESVTHVDSPPLGYPTLVARLTIDGKSLTLINTHPTVPLTRSGFEARNEHLQSVAELARDVSGAVILSGDFNTSVWTPVYRNLEESTGLRNASRGFGILPTWPTFLPFAMIPIDHALVSDDIRVIETRRGGRLGSDHLPLIVTFSIGR